MGRQYARILIHKIRGSREGKIGEQAGFSWEIMCRPDIQTLTDHRKEKMENRDIHLVFIDCIKVYDTVTIQEIFEALSQVEIPKAMMQEVKNVYKKQHTN